MSTRLDIHLHTRRHSACSRIDERELIATAIHKRLNGLVITEHHYQWTQAELDQLREDSLAPPSFILMAGFEYSSRKGDMLIYGLPPEAAGSLKPGKQPEEAFAFFREAGAACVAAHPTREQIPFDDRIMDLRFDGLEVASVNLRPHEQRRAQTLAEGLGIPATAASDAHRIEDVGAFATDFEGEIGGMADFIDALRRGAFRPAAAQT